MAIEKFDQLLKTRQSIARRNKIVPLRKIVRFALSFRMIFLAENERRENLQRRKCWEIGIERSFRSNLQNARTYCHRRSKKNTHKNRRTKEKKKREGICETKGRTEQQRGTEIERDISKKFISLASQPDVKSHRSDTITFTRSKRI